MGTWGAQLAELTIGGWRRFVLTLLIVVLAVSLTSCSSRGQAPDAGVVEQAVVRQLEQTQQALRQQLAAKSLAAAKTGVASVRVRRTQQVSLAGQPAYRVRGTYRLKGKYLSWAQMRSQNPFDLYLQSQDGGQSWEVVQPQG
ncbi:MAG TPA: hypothetical protein V6D06_00720 [Trichocoleus sp.]